jgi:glycosyltransferase involved in cell wall biosynthesis
MLEQITPLVLTYNEAPNIQRTLDKLKWAKEVVIIDSGSNDGMLEMLESYPNVRVVQHEFVNHTEKWNFGVDQVTTRWTLSLDADYVLRDGLIDELTALAPDDSIDAFFVRFRYLVFGRPLRATLYPPRAVLFRNDRCRYRPDGHTQQLEIPGRSEYLANGIDHDDRKPLSRWVVSQSHCAVLEAEKLLTTEPSPGWPDYLRRAIWPAAPATLFYSLFVKGLIFDGWPGVYYTMQRVFAELLLSLELLDRRLRR